MLCNRSEDLFDELGVSFSKNRKMHFGACPIHGGDNPNALNLYTQGDTVPGYWRCNTRHCERVFKKTIIGFVRGVLSHQQQDWTCPDDEPLSFGDTVMWCCKFLGVDPGSIKVDLDQAERTKFASDISLLTQKVNKVNQGTPRKDVIKFLQIPAPYYVDRGYSAEVLRKYDVGFYPHAGKALSGGRVAVPIYNDQGTHAIGFTGRSVHPQCPQCHGWHSPSDACPAPGEEFSKWKNVGFPRESVLYNWWQAKEVIRETRVATIVEGPGEVWRLEEAGIHNSLALLGLDMTEQQQVMLEMSGAMGLVIILNNDKPGRAAAKEIAQRLSRSFRILNVELESNDLGQMTVPQIRSHSLYKQIDDMSRRWA